ncbi:NitT/TauT family transport system ATP-binding protein [Hyphomicrobiales bacterium]|nr:NitT/TauT family transport system ATP-binding protein [Hyphomicrobiales bacterium]CAH1694495.1 NitT/TauT family transport system ATP-binding protein [Hyphomicrobiales bacterium]
MATLMAQTPTLSSESAAPPGSGAIRFNGVRVGFTRQTGQHVRALEDFSLDIPAGQFVSIVGPSGCGKSTLLKVLSGLVEAEAGTALVDGLTAQDSRERIGFMFQRDTLLPWASVEDNIRIGADLSGQAPANMQRRIAELIAFLRLTGFEKSKPHELSGGMRQRVSLGRLLAYDPDILLMDEPFGALDSQTKAAMGQELLRIWAHHRRTVIFVTHDIEEAVTLSDRVVVLSPRPGRIRLDLSIDLPRPRSAAQLRKDARYIDYIDRIWSQIETVS